MAECDYFSLSESTLKELAENGDIEAMLTLGLSYYYGYFGECNVSIAYDYFVDAYAEGEQRAAPFLGEIIYFRQVSISGYTCDDDYSAKAYKLYKEGEEVGMMAATRGICKMMLRGDYLVRDVQGAYDKLKKLEDMDDECAALVRLIDDGSLSMDDIRPNNEFGVEDEEPPEEIYDDSDEGRIMRWLHENVPEDNGFPLSIDLDDDILAHLDDYIKDDIDESCFEFYEYFSGTTVKDLLLDVINSGDDALEMLVALAKVYRTTQGMDADDYARGAYWAYKAAVIARKKHDEGCNVDIDYLDLLIIALGELGNIFFSYSGYDDERFPDANLAAKYYAEAAELDDILNYYNFNINAGRAYAALGRYEEMENMLLDKGFPRCLGQAWCGQMYYIAGDVKSALKYWKQSLEGNSGWGEYFLGRYFMRIGDAYSAVRNWQKGEEKGCLECSAELAGLHFSRAEDRQKNIDRLSALSDDDECVGACKYLYKYYLDREYEFDLSDVERNMLSGDALQRGLRKFCPYCAMLYARDVIETGISNGDSIISDNDDSVEKAMKLWGYDGNKF